MILSVALRAVAAAGILALAPAHRQTDPPKIPFGIGERLVYQVKFGIVSVGEGAMEVIDAPVVRGRQTLHSMFRVKGRALFYSVNDTMETWMDRITLNSLRFTQRKQEGGKHGEVHFDIYPERQVFVDVVKNPDREMPLVADPLDDASFIYFLRTVPLEVGKTYTFDKYFRPDRNPVKIHVLRREEITVPAGTFKAIVIQPSIKTTGIFSEKGKAEVWLSDDDNRIMLQLKSDLPFGSLNLYLKSYTPATNPPPQTEK